MTTASNIFNQFASSKNFSQSGNRITSHQPGKPFASAEALNYIPTGYNTSGGNMFRYGALAAGMVKKFTAKGTGLGRRLTDIESTVAQESLARGVSSDALLADFKKGSIHRGSSDKIQAGMLARDNLKQQRKASKKGQGGEDFLFGKYQEVNRNTKSRISDIRAEQADNVTNPMGGGRTRAETQAEISKLKNKRRALMDKIKGKTSKKSGMMDVFNMAPPTSHTGGDKAGQGFGESFNSHFAGLKDNQKNMLMTAGGIATLGTAGTAYGAITGSKRDPVGSAMTVGLAGAGLASGYRGIGKHLLTSAKQGVKSSSVRNVMKSNNNIRAMRANRLQTAKGLKGEARADFNAKTKSQLNNVIRHNLSKTSSSRKMGQFMAGSDGVDSYNQAAMLGVGVGASMGAVGMGRNITGI